MVKSILKGKIRTGVAQFRLSIRQAELRRLFRTVFNRIYPVNIRKAMLKLQPIRRSSRISVKRYILQEQSGFTLIEALVAIVLLSIIVIGIITVAISAYKLEHFVDARQTAVNYAEWEMEYIKTENFQPAFVVGSSYAIGTTSAYQGYTANNTVTAILNANEQEIKVTVTGNGVTYKLYGYKVNY